MDIAKYAGGELDEIIANYEWTPVDVNGKHFDIIIKIKITKKYNGDTFYAYPSHKIKTPRQATPYFSYEPKASIEDALQDCIMGFKAFMGTVEETTWHPNEDF